MKSKRVSEQGAVAYFVALFLVIIVGSLSFSLNVSSSRSLKSNLQNTVDTAAQLAASTLCSTRACYDDSLEIALNVVKENFSDGLAATNLTFNNPDELYWKNDDAEVIIRRGRWWNTSTPYTEELDDVFIHQESKHHNFIFEDLDRQLDNGESWKSVHSETPPFLVANAIYVSITYNYQNSFFNLFKISKTPIKVRTYALAGDVAEEQCIAPFAIPICNLVSDSGELFKDRACKIERYFTESKRYCTEGTDCDVLPGTLYVPFPSEDKLPYEPVFMVNKALSHYHAYRETETNPGDIGGESYYRGTCDFNTLSLPGISVSDHYGVTGLSVASFDDTTGNLPESEIRQAIAEGCRTAKIGDPFQLRPEGLTEFDTQITVWQQIINQLPVDSSKADDIKHPAFSTEFDRSIFNIFLPKDENHFQSVEHETLANLAACSGSGAPSERYGLCNSQRFYYNTECFEKRNIPDNQLSRDLYTPDILPCPITSSPPTLNAGDNRLTWDLVDFYQNSKVWKVAVPIISTLEGVDRYCSGIASDTGLLTPTDPLISRSLNYYIVGFVDMIFYDADVGMPPPERLSQIPSYPALDLEWEDQWSEDDEPWGFIGGTGCNNVKGMIDCNQGLLSTPQFKLQNERPVRLVIPEENLDDSGD